MTHNLSNLFILGGTRSGTSAVQIGILTSTRYVGDGEGHFITMYDNIMKSIDDFYINNPALEIDGTTAHRVTRQFICHKIQNLIKEIYSDIFEKKVFSDKTPSISAIRLAPVFREIWPDCKIIYCKRRGIENICSKIKKFPNVDFFKHCREWSEAIKEWENVKEKLEEYLEIDQMELARAPIHTAVEIGRYLGLKECEAEALGNWFATSAARSCPGGFAPMDFGKVGWSVEQRQIFVEICDGAMTIGKYTYDEAYWEREFPVDD